MSSLENTRIPYFFAASVVFRIFLPSISHERQLQSLLTIHFLKELNKIFQVHLNTLPKQSKFLAVLSRKCQKWAVFDILITITLRVNITRQMTHTLWALCLLANFLFAFQDLQNLFPWDPPLHYVLVCKIYIYMPRMTLSSLSTKISFFYIKLANFWYRTCFVSNLIPIWPQSHGSL